ncbi:hypothetical protein Fot_22142 [Forsythia ovata]|uniref:Uncharacterized protein n=1 Tax=Forsythia ovata TaxID=205694 RepID=A0ABD1UWV6_9LAMI
MSNFYFPSVPKLKIRRGGLWMIHPPPVPSTVSVLGVTVLQTPETMVGNSSFISLTSAVTPETPSALFPTGPASPSENLRQSSKRKAETDSRKETFWIPVPPLVECINIGFHRDELDPTVLEKLPVPAAIVVASVHKYWTYAFEKVVDNAELMELLKLAKMGDEDVDALRSENKGLREQLAFSEDARTRAIYNITKAKTIQMACVQAQKKAELQLRSCQNMVHAKDKELTEALNELLRAQDLLAKLGVLGYADPKGPTGT